MTQIYRRFLDGTPIYLARHYWWAYLWRVGVWLFDHQFIINAILFGQYRKLMQVTLERLKASTNGRILQLTCVYGMFTPKLLGQLAGRGLHITDVAPVQLALARRKTKHRERLLATRMNVESLGYRDSSFDTVIIFFLLHEMPDDARHRTVEETVRVLKSGGRLLIAEYGPMPVRHVLYRVPPLRWVLTRLEPFLASFWHEDIGALANEMSVGMNREVKETWHKDVFASFYRVTEYAVVTKSSA